MKQLTFDRDGCRDLRAALDSVLAKLGEELGATIKAGNASYDPTTNRISIKIEATAGDTERLTFNRLALGYGFKEEDYGKPFTTAQGTFLLRGVTPSGCVLGTDSHGKGVKWPTKATDSIVKKFHPDHKSWEEKMREAARQPRLASITRPDTHHADGMCKAHGDYDCNECPKKGE